MISSNKLFSAAVILAGCLTISAQTRAQESPQLTGTDVIAVATSRPISELLPDRLAEVRATSQIKQYGAQALQEIAGNKAAVYREYGVVSAASRQYGPNLVEIFQTENPFGALGLLSYTAGLSPANNQGEQIGSGSKWLADALVFWRSSYFVRISAGGRRIGSYQRSSIARLAGQLSSSIAPAGSRIVTPPLVNSLPRESDLPQTIYYFLGPESLKRYVKRGDEMFGFDGGAEAVMGEYDQGGSARDTSPLNLLIVEYHTPQFAHDALERLNSYVASLPGDEQSQIVYRREGNYVVEATNVRDRETAERVVNSVKYPYLVKWLRNPLLPTEDPFRAQKAAQMLLSTFGIVGLVMMTALLVGTACGTMIFIKRRKRLQAIFSDAGGMLRLDINPIPGTSLGPGCSESRLLGSGDRQGHYT